MTDKNNMDETLAEIKVVNASLATEVKMLNANIVELNARLEKSYVRKESFSHMKAAVYGIYALNSAIFLYLLKSLVPEA